MNHTNFFTKLHTLNVTGLAAILSDFHVHLKAPSSISNKKSEDGFSATLVQNLVTGFASGVGIEEANVMCTGIVTGKYQVKTQRIHEDKSTRTTPQFSHEAINNVQIALQDLLGKGIILGVEHMGNRNSIRTEAARHQWEKHSMSRSDNFTRDMLMSEVSKANTSFQKRMVLQANLTVGITTMINQVYLEYFMRSVSFCFKDCFIKDVDALVQLCRRLRLPNWCKYNEAHKLEVQFFTTFISFLLLAGGVDVCSEVSGQGATQ